MVNELKIILRKNIIVTTARSLFYMIKWVLLPEKCPEPFVPHKLLSQYTMNGKMKVKHWYRNDTYTSSKPRIYKKEKIDSLIRQINSKKIFYYGKTDLWLYQALEKFPIKDKETAIIGSSKPIYESICIFFGGRPTTIEYNKIISKDSRLKTLTVDEYNRSPIRFDAAFSISSFEHDGLGRYGDPLNPDGDILAMSKMKSILKPGGIFFLSVPVGKDTLVWNAHRIYGKHRLPLLLRGFELLATFGFSETLLEQKYTQPIFVLRNNP